MLEEDDESHFTDVKQKVEVCDGDEKGKESGSPANIAPTHSSDCCQQNTDNQTPVHQHCHSRNPSDSNEDHVTSEEPSAEKVSCTKFDGLHHTDSDMGFVNGSTLDKCFKGTRSQERMITLSSVQKKDITMVDSLFPVASNQPVTGDSGQTGIIIKDNCPPPLSDMHDIPTSNPEGENELRLGERTNRGHGLRAEQQHAFSMEEKNKTSASEQKVREGHVQDIQSTVSSTQVSGVFSVAPHPELNELCETASLGNLKESQSVALATEDEEKTCVLKCFDPNVTLLQSEDKVIVQPVQKVIVEHSDKGISPQHQVVRRRKVGRPPKKRRVSKTLDEQNAGCAHRVDFVHRVEEKYDGRKMVSDFFDVSEKGKTLETGKMEANVMPESSKELSVLRFDNLKVSDTVPLNEFTAVIPGNVKPKKKVGRPRKKCVNMTEPTGVEGAHIYTENCKKESVQCVTEKNIFDKASFSARKKKKIGREWQMRNSVCEVSSQEITVSNFIKNDMMHTKTSARNLTETQAVPSVLRGIKGARKVNPNGPLSKNPQKHQNVTVTETKKGKKVVQTVLASPNNCPDERVRNASNMTTDFVHANKFQSFLDEGRKANSPGLSNSVVMSQCCPVSNESVGSCEERGENMKATMKSVKENTVLEKQVRTKKSLPELKDKLKRKIGRPLKKKTLIKRAKELEVPQDGRIKISERNKTGHSETHNAPCDTASHHLKRNKKGKKKVADIPEAHLRRYTRACKAVTHVKKDGLRKLGGKPYLNSLLTVESKTEIFAKPTSKLSEMIPSKRRDKQISTPESLKKKRKYNEVVKSEEGQQALCDFALKNSKAKLKVKPTGSHDTVSNSVLTISENPSNLCSKKRRITKFQQVLFKRRNNKPRNTNTVPHMQDNLRATPRVLPLPKHKSEDITCDPGKGGKYLRLERVDEAVSVLKMKGLQETFTQNTYVSASHLELNSMSVLHQTDAPDKCLLSPRDTVKSIDSSSVKVPRKRGRPRKNLTILNPECGKEVKEKVCPSASVVNHNAPLSKASHSGPVGCEAPHLHFSNLKIRQHKVDRRRKRFRRQKALMGMDDVLSKTVGNISDKANSVLQKHSMTIKVDRSLQNLKGTKSTGNNLYLLSDETHIDSSKQKQKGTYSTDMPVKQSRKGVGSWKRRRRKRSWWDDRGKARINTSAKELDAPLQFSEDHINTETIEKSSKHDEVTTELRDETVSVAQTSLQKETAQTHVLTGQIGHGEDSLAVIQPSGGKNITVQSEEQTESEKLCLEDHENQEKTDSLRTSADNQFTVVGISESKTSSLEDEGSPLESMPEVVVESCKIKVDNGLVEEIPEEKNSSETQNRIETHESEASEAMIYEKNLEVTGVAEISKENALHINKRDKLSPIQEMAPQEKSLQPAEAIQGNTSEVNSLLSKEFEDQTVQDPKFPGDAEGSSCLYEDPPCGNGGSKNLSVEPFRSKNIQNKNIEDTVSETGQSDIVLDKDKCGGSNTDNDCSKNLLEEAPLTLQSLKPHRRQSKFEVKKPVECHYCGRCFHHISSYIIHRRIHTGEKPYSCQECGKAFAQRSNLNAHRKVHKIPEYMQCSYCKSRFSDKGKLCHHYQTHKQDSTLPSVVRKTGNERTNIEIHPKSDTACPSSAVNDVKLHVCEVCGKGFCFYSKLKIHLRVHSGEKPYSCKVCGKSFSQACTLRVHERIHWSIKPYVCSVCGKGFSQLGTLKTHLWRHVGKNHIQEVEKAKPAVTFQCHICKKSFGLRHQYNLHMRIHTDLQLYTCDVCSKKYTQIFDLNIHRQSCLKLTGKQVSAIDGGNNDLDCTAQLPHVQPGSSQHAHLQSLSRGFQQEQPCKSVHAQEQSKNSSQVKSEHQPSQASPRPDHSLLPESPIFDLKYPLQCCYTKHCLFRLQYHRKSDPRKYLCPRCNRLFRHLGRLRAHMLTHVRGQSYTCSYCGKVLENWSKFWMHQRVHRQKRGRFFCPKCSQGFRFVGLYKQHLEEHREQKPYVCPLCPCTFSQEESLRNHQRELHKFDKPYTCNACGKCFFHRKKFERHVFVHHRSSTHFCSFCSLSFLHAGELQSHLNTHVNQKVSEVSSQFALPPYQCGECNARFKTRNLLFHHELCHSSTVKQKTWQIVGQQHHFQSSYRSKPTTETFVQPKIALLDNSQITRDVCVSSDTGGYRNSSTVYHQNSAGISSSFPAKCVKTPWFLSFPSQQGHNKLVHTHGVQSLDDNVCLPQTLSTTAVPSPERRPQRCSPHTQKGSHVPSSPRKHFHKISQDRRRVDCQTDQAPAVQSLPLRKASSSSDGDNEGDAEEHFDCAECGAQFDDVPKLYEHYLQHARGEL